jgi:hypothetical protein
MTLRWVPGWNGLTDPEAVSYVAAVEAADGQELEHGVAKAINDFVLGCKNDGIWDAIKASCILAGARTLSGALVPLVGTAPTNYNFVSGDYNRETGLKGNGSTKYLDSKRNNNADPQDNRHLAVYASTRNTETSIKTYIRATFAPGIGATQILTGAVAQKISTRCSADNTNTSSGNLHSSNGFFGVSRSLSASYAVRGSGINETITQASIAPGNANYFVFAGNNKSSGTTDVYSDGRLAFYSIGESLDLSLLDTRVSNLITAIGAAIP